MTTMKNCSNEKCKEKQPLSCFSKKTAAKDGHQSMCKPCVSSYDKARKIKKRKKLRKLRKLWKLTA